MIAAESERMECGGRDAYILNVGADGETRRARLACYLARDVANANARPVWLQEPPLPGAAPLGARGDAGGM